MSHRGPATTTVSALLIGGLFAAAAEPRRPTPVPFSDPQAMLNRLFGPESEEDEQALADIHVSPQDERRYGELAVEAFLAELKRRNIRVVSRGKEVDYLRALVETVRPQLPNPDRQRKIPIYLALSPECEARSFPGGTLIFFHGLLEQAENEAAVVGIVGHELAHEARGHHSMRARRAKLAEQRFAEQTGQFSPERFLTAGTAMARLWTRPFRPEDEAAADRDGAAWAYATGYDPRELAKLFLRVHQQRPNPQAVLPGFWQTHPALESRAQAVELIYDKLQADDPQGRLYVGRENLRRRIPRSAQTFPP